MVAMGAIVLSGCMKVKNEVITSTYDSSKTTVASIEYVEGESSATTMTFNVYGAAAKAAGSTTFTVFLATDCESDVLGNGATFKIVDAADTAQVKFTKLKEGDVYRPRVRANYDPFIYSSWTDIPGKAALVGTGLVDLAFGAPVSVTTTPTDETLAVKWSQVPYATSYIVESKASSASEWEVSQPQTTNSYTIVGLNEFTDYDVRVKAVNKDAQESDYKAVTAKTQKSFNFKKKEQVVEFFTSRAAAAAATDKFSLAADIDMEGATLPAVAAFVASFDGQGHALKNLKITEPLFTENSGTISNLIIDASCTVEAAGSFSIIVGKNTNKGTLEKVVNKASFTSACPADAAEGFAIGAVARISYGKVVDCTNEGNIKVTCDGVMASPAVAGVVAYQKDGTFTGNKNVGQVLVEHKGTTNASIPGFDRKPFATIGGVLGVVVSTSVEKCENEGPVTVSCSAAGKIGARHYVGGVTGTAEKECSLIECKNKAVVKVDFTNDATGKQVWVGGIAGGRNADYKEFDGCVEIKNCVNEGDIYLTSDWKGSNNYLAGIAGQALIEAPGDLTGKDAKVGVMKGCTNKGKLTSSGAAQIRVGGLSGGAATIEDSANEGELIIGHSGKGAVGGLVGYPTQTKHPVKNSRNTGNITVLDAANVGFGVGGLFGQGGNTVQNYEGCTVDCKITAPSKVWAGIVLGTANSLENKTITYGTAGNPFKVRGTVNETTLTAGNYRDYLIGDGGVVKTGGVIETTNVLFAE